MLAPAATFSHKTLELWNDTWDITSLFPVRIVFVAVVGECGQLDVDLVLHWILYEFLCMAWCWTRFIYFGLRFQLLVFFLIEMTVLYIYDSHPKDKTSGWPTYPNKGNHHTCRMTSFYSETDHFDGLVPEIRDSSALAGTYPPTCLSFQYASLQPLLAKLFVVLGAVSIRKTVLPGMAIPMLKIRRPNGRLIFNMENAIRR